MSPAPLEARLRRLLRVDGVPLRRGQAAQLAAALARQQGIPALRRSYLAALRGLGLDAGRSSVALLLGGADVGAGAMARAGVDLDGYLGVHELWAALAGRAIRAAWARDAGGPMPPRVEDMLIVAAVDALGDAVLDAQARFDEAPKPDQRRHLGPCVPAGIDLMPLRLAYLRALDRPPQASVVGRLEVLLSGGRDEAAEPGRPPAPEGLLADPRCFSVLELPIRPQPPPAVVDRSRAEDPRAAPDDEREALLYALRDLPPGARPCYPLADAILTVLSVALDVAPPASPPWAPRTDAAPAGADSTDAAPAGAESAGFAPSPRAQAWAAVAAVGPMDQRAWAQLAAGAAEDDPFVAAAFAAWAGRGAVDEINVWERLAAALARRRLGQGLRALRDGQPPAPALSGPARAALQARWLEAPEPWHPPARRARASQRFRLELGVAGTDRRLVRLMWRTLGTPAAQLGWALREWSAAEKVLQHLSAGLPPEDGGEALTLLRPLVAPAQAASGFTSAVSRVGEAAWSLVEADLALERSRPRGVQPARWRRQQAAAARPTDAVAAATGEEERTR